MEQKIVEKGSWIKIGDPDSFSTYTIDGYVIDTYPDGSLGVGYYQNNIKAIKTDVIWNGKYWQFKQSAPHGVYLHDVEEHIVKNGPSY